MELVEDVGEEDLQKYLFRKREGQLMAAKTGHCN